MCLLITQNNLAPALTDDWLADFYDYNSDGVGVMRAENNQLIIKKILPKSAKEFIAFYREHIEGKSCAFHLRMRTHGLTDLDNCHPYEVLNASEHGVDLWLMHNGILHTGNNADVSKSDTYHYIANYIRPLIQNNPDIAFTDEFADVIGNHIGESNKFVMLDNFGRMTTINKSAGVYWGGIWLSNTYAWSAPTGTSKTPIKGIKKARKQIDKKPMAYSSPVGKTYSSYPYGAGVYGSYYDDDREWSGNVRSKSYDLDDALDYDIEYILDQCFDEGYFEVSKLTNSQARAFIREFGEASFFDLAYMVLENRIEESEFMLAMSDYDHAKKSYSWLDYESTRIREVA